MNQFDNHVGINGEMNMLKNLNIRIQLFHEPNPFIYIQNDLESKRYRVSTNYKFLNEEFKLKIHFIRNFSSATIKEAIKNTLIEVIDHNDSNFSVFFKDRIYDESEYKFNTDVGINTLKLFKYVYGRKEDNNRTCILILNKKYLSESNYSLFFATEIPEINDFASFLKYYETIS